MLQITSALRAIAVLTAFQTCWTATAHAQDIYQAIEQGDLPAVKRIVAANRRMVFDERYDSNRRWRRPVETPLSKAIDGEKLDIVTYLVEKGANPDVDWEYGTLYISALRKPSIYLRLLLEHRLNPNITHNDYPLLQFAVDLDSLAHVAELLKRGANPNGRNREGCTALYVARSSAMVDLLVANGADVDHAADDQARPLHYAAVHDTSAVVALLRHGAAIDAPDADGDTPLAWAALYWKPESVASLVQFGAHVDARGLHNETPLVSAVRRYAHNLPDSIRKRNGGDFMSTMDCTCEWPEGYWRLEYSLMTPVDTPAILQTIDLLLRLGADPNAADAAGTTSMHIAARAGMMDVAEVLVQHNADVNVRDRKGRTPLALARTAHKRAMIKLLREHGAK